MVEFGAEGCVNALVDYDRFPDKIVEPDWLVSDPDPMMRREMMAMLGEDERRAKRQEQQRRQRQAVNKLKPWWLSFMRTTNRPFQEKLTLFWHGHFAVAHEKVKNSEVVYDYYRTLRNGANGNFRDLVSSVGKSPAMLIYLDNRQNRKGRPNENWARELLELFTMGIGNYTEDEIKEAARAFTGHTLRKGGYFFAKGQHDNGAKEFFGKRGRLDWDDVIDAIMDDPQTARFISRKLWEHFVYEGPSDALVEEMAAVLRGADYELKPLLSAMFMSKEFYSDRARGNQIKSPAQFLVQIIDQLGAKIPREQMLIIAMRGLGQDLLNPPNVKGWDGNRDWINTNTLLLRYNIPAYVVTGTRFDRQETPRLDEGEAGMGMMGGANPGRRNARPARVRPLFDVAPIYERHAGKDVATAALDLSQEFLARPLDSDQYSVYLAAFGAEGNARFNIKNVKRSELLSALHLLLSTAEYQLC